MPTSLFEQWPEILRLAASVNPREVLDVGPGCGKAAPLFREWVPSTTRMDAVEAHCQYIYDHHLRMLYHQVTCGRFEEMSTDGFGKYDLVLMVDVIEHIEEGLAVPALRRVRHHLLVCTPDVFAQDWRPGMPLTEQHVSVWSPEMVECVGFRRVEVVCQYDGWIGLFQREGCET